MTIKVFVSSTLRDDELFQERNLAQKIVGDELRMSTIMWELLPKAMPKSPEDAYLEGVAQSDIYVGIIGQRDSPGSAREFREARRLAKHCFIFVKETSKRESGAEAFLGEVKESVKVADYSALEEFASHLKQSLLDFLNELASRSLRIQTRLREEFVTDYQKRFVVPWLEEANTTRRLLSSGSRFARLPAEAWEEASGGIFFGAYAPLDELLRELYANVKRLNNLYDRIVIEYKADIDQAVEEAFLKDRINVLNILGIPYREFQEAARQILTSNIELLLASPRDCEDYEEKVQNLLDQLDGALTVGREQTADPMWIYNKVKKLWVLRPRKENPVDTYRKLAGDLLPRVEEVCRALTRVYRGDVSLS
jgi:hypothetical protein